MKLRDIFLSCLAIVCAACASDVETLQPQTGFHLTLKDDVAVQTRMTPADLGAPVATQFNLKITNDKSGQVAYDAAYQEFVKAENGDYTLTATCGENPVLAINSPFYMGQAQASITTAAPESSVTIPCKVANSLLSVSYLDEEGNVSTSCFDELFSFYAVRAEIGSLSVELTNSQESAYFRAGTLPSMTFFGTLAGNGHEVEFGIPSSSLPSEPLAAADHLIVRLKLETKSTGDVEINVEKANVEQVTIEETLSLDWLPAEARPVIKMSEQEKGYAWAHSLYVKPITVDDIEDAKIFNPASLCALAVYDISLDGGETWQAITEQRDGLYYFAGLEPGTEYLLRARIGEKIISQNNASVTTETEDGVPNGDFEDLRETLTVSKLNCGADYSVKVLGINGNYQNYATFTIMEPNEWASVNGKTCNVDLCNVPYTWYANPTTYNTSLSWSQFNDFRKSTKNKPAPYENLSAQSGGNAMVLRNVGWDHNGSTVARTGGNMNRNYYNTNVPTVGQRSSGKLFLGSYSYSGGSETYNEGANFASRPTILNGYYKYVQDGDNNEYGTVTVTLLNGDTMLGTGTQNLTARGDYGQFSVPINYTIKTLHPTSLRIMFTSSRYASYTQSEETANVKTTTYNGEYESCMRGATLTVDNLTFTYER